MVADTGPSCIDTLTMEDSGSFTSAETQVDIRHPDETAPLMPVTVLSNRQRCLSQCCFLSDLYYLFLLAQGAMLILCMTYFWISLILDNYSKESREIPHWLMRSNYNQEVNHVPRFVNMKRFLKFAIAYNFFGILNYIIFTAIVVKSQIFLGLSIVCRNLNHLLEF